MTASWVTTLKGMIDRGTGDLTTVDNAFKKKVITEPERVDVYNYWYQKRPTLTSDFALTEAAREVAASWSSPTEGDLHLAWNDGVGNGAITVPAADGTHVFTASTFDASATSVTVSAAVPRPDTGALQRAVSQSVTFQVVTPDPTPEPTSEPTPDAPTADAPAAEAPAGESTAS